MRGKHMPSVSPLKVTFQHLRCKVHWSPWELGQAGLAVYALNLPGYLMPCRHTGNPNSQYSKPSPWPHHYLPPPLGTLSLPYVFIHEVLQDPGTWEPLGRECAASVDQQIPALSGGEQPPGAGNWDPGSPSLAPRPAGPGEELQVAVSKERL